MTVVPKSRYAQKVRGVIDPLVRVRQRHRKCGSCSRTLSGKRGHGFPTKDGRNLQCGTCMTERRPIA